MYLYIAADLVTWERGYWYHWRETNSKKDYEQFEYSNSSKSWREIDLVVEYNGDVLGIPNAKDEEEQNRLWAMKISLSDYIAKKIGSRLQKIGSAPTPTNIQTIAERMSWRELKPAEELDDFEPTKRTLSLYVPKIKGYVQGTRNKSDISDSKIASPSVFLSHSHKDKLIVQRIRRDLRSRGITVWLDSAEMRVGDSLIGKISEAIKENDFVAAVISSSSVTSEWVLTELNQAMNKEINQKKVVILPIRIDDCEMPPFLEAKYYIDLSTQVYSENISKLARDIKRHYDERI